MVHNKNIFHIIYGIVNIIENKKENIKKICIFK